jgi:hypothetical protein
MPPVIIIVVNALNATERIVGKGQLLTTPVLPTVNPAMGMIPLPTIIPGNVLNVIRLRPGKARHSIMRV